MINIKIHIFLFLSFFSICYSIGCIRGNCYNGSGTIVFRNGEIYSGEFKEGKKNGYGIHYYGPSLNEKQNYELLKELRPIISADKNFYGKYEGEWEDNMKWGFGKYTFPNGQFYLGEYKRDKRRGIGMLVFGDKTFKFIGEFRMSEKDGLGISHKIIPSLKDSKYNLEINSGNQFFLKNDSLNIIDSGSFYKDEKSFNEPLDTVIIKFFKKYSDRALILQHLRIYNEVLVDSLLNSNSITMKCGELYEVGFTDCPFDWECIEDNCIQPNIPSDFDENLNCFSENYDCFGVCDGNAVIDECGICGGNGISEGICDCYGSVLDCNGECDGTAILDDCGICCGGTGSVSGVICSWAEYPGIGNMDECGVCNGSGLNEFGCCGKEERDCEDICGGLSEFDECGVCNGSGLNEFGCCGKEERDCEDICGGLSEFDECGICNGNGLINCKNGQSVCSIDDCTEDGCDLPINSVKIIDNQILYNSQNPIYGFEIKMNGSIINKVFGDNIESKKFNATIIGSNVIGRSINNTKLDVDCGILFQIDIKNEYKEIKSFSIYNNFGIPQQLKIIK